MNRLIDGILKQRRVVITLTILLLLVSVVCITQVQVNYHLADYLPADAPSTLAYAQVDQSTMPNMQLVLKGLSVAQVLDAKEKIVQIPHVNGVLWLDSMADLTQPLEMLDEATVSQWYKDGYAQMLLTVDESAAKAVISDIYALYPDALPSGKLVNTVAVQKTLVDEIMTIILFAVPLVLLVLLMSTSSWIEPLLFIFTIGIAIMINEGTNLLLGEVSFITRACSAILQLAVSLDYAVFLLHRFSDEREQGKDALAAMAAAMRASGSAIAASAMTTVFGFLSLMLMEFSLGKDMGLVLAKGILLSYISVMVVLPAMAVGMTKLLDKTRHRMLLPRFNRVGKFITRYAMPIAIVLLLLIVPSFIAQQQNDFIYGAAGMEVDGSVVQQDAAEIQAVFGNRQQMILLVPSGDPAREAELAAALQAIPEVATVIAYSNAVGTQIPWQMLSASQQAQLSSGAFSRLVIYADCRDEGNAAFSLVENLYATIDLLYPTGYHLLGENIINYDLMRTITADSLKVQLGAAIPIFIILLITFRSLSLPVFLLLTIEGAVWINLSIPYFTGIQMNYIGYLIISSVQLGATVDYGILMAQEYLSNRRLYGKREAVSKTVAYTLRSTLPSALILFIAGTLLGVISTTRVIGELGTILGRGAGISLIMVIVVLPMLLLVFDKFILKTTLQKKAGGPQ